MIHNHSTNKLIIKAVASLNKAIRSHAYRAILSGFKVKSKAQFIANVVSAKITLPSWMGVLPKSKKKKLDTAQCFWDTKYTFHTEHNGNADFKYVRPTLPKGYGAILTAAEKLGEFSWSELLLSLPHYQEKIKNAYRNWCRYGGYKIVRVKGKEYKVQIGYMGYVSNYLNSYRSYFLRNRIMVRVKGTNKLQLTADGKKLLAGMKQLPSMR